MKKAFIVYSLMRIPFAFATITALYFHYSPALIFVLIGQIVDAYYLYLTAKFNRFM
jgi:hypothetical protein